MLRFIDNGDDTVTDSATGLMWQKEHDGSERTWNDAISYCRGLTLGSFSDWRLPTLGELLSIAGKVTGQNISAVFAGAKLDRYWTATEFTRREGTTAYTVDFADGAETSYFKVNRYYVRAVRGGTP